MSLSWYMIYNAELGRKQGALGRFRKDRMATKSKLEQAVEQQAADLNDAQRELVKSQLSAYKINAARLSQIKSQLDAVNAKSVATRDEVREKQAYRASLTYEQAQLSAANAKIAAELFVFLKEE